MVSLGSRIEPCRSETGTIVAFVASNEVEEERVRTPTYRLDEAITPAKLSVIPGIPDAIFNIVLLQFIGAFQSYPSRDVDLCFRANSAARGRLPEDPDSGMT